MKSSSLINLLFSSGFPSFGYQFQHHSIADRNLMLQNILSEQGAVVTDGPSVTLVEIEKMDTIYLITQSGHFAHPSILKRSLAYQQKSRSVEVSGFTACAPKEMAMWMAQFKEQDAQMRNANMS
jgi:hypothetical protein